MCKHTSATVVAAAGAITCYQCDVCGVLLPERDPGETTPVAFDADAYTAWLKRSLSGNERSWQQLEALQARDPAAYRAEVRRLLSCEDSGDGQTHD